MIDPRPYINGNAGKPEPQVIISMYQWEQVKKDTEQLNKYKSGQFVQEIMDRIKQEDGIVHFYSCKDYGITDWQFAGTSTAKERLASMEEKISFLKIELSKVPKFLRKLLKINTI